MTDHVYKKVDLVGSFTKSIEAAIKTAIQTAGKLLKNFDWFEVVETRGHVEKGQVAHYQVVLKVGFRIEA